MLTLGFHGMFGMLRQQVGVSSVQEALGNRLLPSTVLGAMETGCVETMVWWCL